MGKVLLTMFWFFLCMCLMSGVKTQNTLVNTDDTETTELDTEIISKLQFSLIELRKHVHYIENEIRQYSLPTDNLREWREQNVGALVENNRLLSALNENVTSTMNIFNYTSQAFEEGTTLLCLERERGRAQAIEEALKRLEQPASSVAAHLKSSDVQLAAMTAQQQETDRGLKEQQARLEGLRGEADTLLKREGAFEFGFKELLAKLHAYQERIEEIKDGKKRVKDEVERVKTKTAELEKAITGARNELQSLKTTNSKIITVTKSPSVNFIKSVKTASGKGKKIKLILLSD